MTERKRPDAFLKALREEMDHQWREYAREDLAQIQTPMQWQARVHMIGDAEADAHLPKLLERLGFSRAIESNSEREFHRRKAMELVEAIKRLTVIAGTIAYPINKISLRKRDVEQTTSISIATACGMIAIECPLSFADLVMP